MTVACPNGHASATANYCDQCGVPIAQLSAGEQTEILPVVDDPDTSAAVPEVLCPICRTPRHGDDRFCEVDGYDFVTASVTTTEALVWEAVVRADRERLDRFGPEGLEFPDDWVGLTVELVAPAVRIGRECGQTEPHEQKLELSGPPMDPGISRPHALLERLPDGGWEVRDLGSTNGTWINSEPTPLTGARRLQVGDRIGLGAWTVIELRSRPI
jgi:hypothetical protein